MTHTLTFAAFLAAGAVMEGLVTLYTVAVAKERAALAALTTLVITLLTLTLYTRLVSEGSDLACHGVYACGTALGCYVAMVGHKWSNKFVKQEEANVG